MGLGHLLGDTVVKWVVCPLNSITNQTELDELDAQLGTEDDLARWYAAQAYAKYTGEENALPGEECPDTVEGLPRIRKCHLAEMREDMPEPYPGEEFICPTRPLLPAKQQIDVFKSKTLQCPLRMNKIQMNQSNWFYYGYTPEKKQYDKMENLPTDQYQAVKWVRKRSLPDQTFGVWREWVTVGLGCTEEEYGVTPRWCEAPSVLNKKPRGINLLTGIELLPLPTLGGDKDKITNGALQERIGSFFKAQWKGLESWARTTYSEWLGRAKGRYDRLKDRLFDEMEVGEMVHSTTFQVEMEDTGGDSKDRQKYERYAVVAPCQDFQPEEEFSLKFQWAETGLTLARNALKQSKDLLGGRAFQLQLRAEGVLHMRNEKNAWIGYYTHIRGARLGEEMPDFQKTTNAILQSLSGALSSSAITKIEAQDLRGFQATYTCGRRATVHGLPLEGLQPSHLQGDADLGATFQECVVNGARHNENLRSENPGKPFLPGEVVVRMTMAELEACYLEVDPALVQQENETDNSVFKNFMGVKGCSPTLPPLPRSLESMKSAGTYRGMLLGKGVPYDTLQEVLIDPADVKIELDL